MGRWSRPATVERYVKEQINFLRHDQARLGTIHHDAEFCTREREILTADGRRWTQMETGRAAILFFYTRIWWDLVG